MPFHRIIVPALLLGLSLNPFSYGTELGPLPPQATIRLATVEVRVAPDHRDWSYETSEPARFTISVVADGTPIDDAVVHYEIGPEIVSPTLEDTVSVPLDGLVIEAGTMEEPGFLRCTVSTEVAGKTYTGSAIAAALTDDRLTLTVGVVNPTAEPASLHLTLPGITLTGPATRWHIGGTDPEAHNTPGEPRRIDIEESPGLDLSGSLEVPAMSCALFSVPVLVSASVGR